MTPRGPLSFFTFGKSWGHLGENLGKLGQLPDFGCNSMGGKILNCILYVVYIICIVNLFSKCDLY